MPSNLADMLERLAETAHEPSPEGECDPNIVGRDNCPQCSTESRRDQAATRLMDLGETLARLAALQERALLEVTVGNESWIEWYDTYAVQALAAGQDLAARLTAQAPEAAREGVEE